MFRCLLLTLSLLGCSKADDSKALEPAGPDVFARFDAASERLETEFLENGWVVSRKADGSPDKVGEGLIWSGMYVGVADCDSALATEEMLQETILRHEGGLVRYEPLGSYSGGREVTLDGALGLYWGIAHRVARCPDTREAWGEIVGEHWAFVEANDGRLHPNTPIDLVPEFTYVLDLLAHRLAADGPGEPAADRLSHLMLQISAWAFAVTSQHAAAYRIHLGLLAIQTIEALGVDIPSARRNEFCAASHGADMPTVDHWCGRGDLLGWIDAFRFNAWEFRHQRSGAWESPDAHGITTPGLDLLVAIRQAYQL